MKTLEEIGKMSPEELEKAAAASPAPVPSALREHIRQRLAAVEIAEEPPRHPAGRAPWAVLAVAAAAAAALFVGLPMRGPADTFDDPYLAYAEVEKAFQAISDKMNDGVEIARTAGSAAEIPQNILNKIQSK